MQNYKPYTGRAAFFDDMTVFSLVGIIVLSIIALVRMGPEDMPAAPGPPEIAQTSTTLPDYIADELRIEFPIPLAEPEPVIVTEAAPVFTPLGTMQIYGYNPYDPAQVNKKVADGIAASGELAIPGETCAMYGVPFGTRIYIEGLGYYRVNDRGVGPGTVDIACATNAECYALTGLYEVYVVHIVEESK